MPTQQQKCEAFAALHQWPTPFLIPNPYDGGSARILQSLGFPAIATSSRAFAYTLGKADGDVTLEEKLEHCRLLATATDIPISVDFEDGYADDPRGVADNVLRLAETGVAGCSVEDFGRASKRIMEPSEAAERVQAAAEAVGTLGMPFQLTARAENLIRGVDDLDDTIERLVAYQHAGADVLYPPGLRTPDALRRVAEAVSRPINANARFFEDAVTVAELGRAGARRISIGGDLGSLSYGPVIAAAREMIDTGTFAWLRALPDGVDRLIDGAP